MARTLSPWPVALAVCLFAAPVLHAADPLAGPRERVERGNYAEAEAALVPLVAEAATAERAAILLARVYAETGRSERALVVLNEAASRNATPDVLAERAAFYYHRGRFLEAEADAKAATASAQDHLLARLTLARIARDTGNLADADKRFRELVRYYSMRSNADRDITQADELHSIAVAGAENARTHQLPKQFAFILNEVIADALKDNPNHWPAEVLAGEMLAEKYNLPDAKDALRKALRINPNAAAAHAALARIALTEYDLTSAEQSALKALEVDAENVAALQVLAGVEVAGENFEKAQEMLVRARSRHPRHPRTLGQLAAVAFLRKQPEEFARLEAEAVAFDSAPAGFYGALAATLEEQKFYPEAIRYYELATEKRPKSAEAQVALGMMRLRLGDEAGANTVLAAALKADPFNVRVANSIKVLTHLKSYTTLETEHYVLKYDAATDALLAKFLAEYLEEVHAKLKAEYGFEPGEKTVVELFNNHDMFSGRTIGVPDLKTVGACTGRVFCLASPTAKGVRKPFNWGRVVRHELTHIFNLTQTDFAVPHWLTEGLAVRSEGLARPRLWNLVLRDAYEQKTLYTIDTVLYGFLRPKNQARLALAYAQSQLYVDYVTETFGPEAVAKFLDAYKRRLSTKAAVEEVCRVPLAEFEAGYLKYVGKLVAAFPKPTKKSIPDRTIDEIEEALRADPDDADALVQQAEFYMKRDNGVAARKVIDQVLGDRPDHPEANLLKAQLFERSGDTEAAAAILERALKAHPDHPKLLMAMGRVYLQNEELAEAARAYEHGRKVAPLDADWLGMLKTIYARTEDDEKLTAVLSELVAGDPDDLESRVKLATVYYDTGKYPEAESLAQEALRIDVKNVAVQELLIDALKAQKKLKEAEAFARRVAAD